MSWKSAAILAFCITLPHSSLAVMLGLSTHELTRSASLIVIGNVVSVTSEWIRDKQAIITTAEVSVAEVLKGPKTDTLRVTYMGGQVGDKVMRQSDAPALKPGENVLLFLAPGEPSQGAGVYAIQGRAQGKYTIGGDRVARKQGFSAVSGDPENMDLSIPLEALTRKIRSQADGK